MKRKICINHNPGIGGVNFNMTIDAVKAAGFDGVFTGWSRGRIAPHAEYIRNAGLYYQSVHAPFNRMYQPWEEGEDGDGAIDELIECLQECAASEVPIMIIHPIIGMDRHNPTDLGIARFSRLVEAAEKTSTKLAFENVEGIEYLKLIIEKLGSSSSVGFCWDTGHEMCYNGSSDVPLLYGDKLLCTHINDNLGQTDPTVITWHDDSHLMPFDGVANWQGVADRLARVNYSGELTFELNYNSKPGKNTHDIYHHLDIFGYHAEAYKRALRLAALLPDKNE